LRFVNVSDIAPTLEQAIEILKKRSLDERALRSLFLEARTANGFLDAPVSRELLGRAVEIAELGPTSANALPARYVFVQSPEAKERLKPAVGPTNLDKTMKAPATVIVAADVKFYENFARTFPTRPEMADRFKSPEQAEATKGFARDNALLQMGYFILAARALGLDCGPMGGFDRAKVDAEFFADGRFISLYLINIGYIDDSKGFPRLPRLEPAEIATFL
jgi:3-hydroxypropanoate dehydrogenase